MADPSKATVPEMPSTWDKTKVTVIDDGKGNPVPLPKGFYYVGGDIDSGIVISDKSGDTIDEFRTSMRKPILCGYQWQTKVIFPLIVMSHMQVDTQEKILSTTK